MRKKLSVVAIIFLFLLTACGKGSKPDAVVRKFCNSMKEFDIETMQSCVASDGDDIEDTTDSGDDYQILRDYIEDQAKNIKYSIEETEVDGDTGTVEVTFEYTDAAPLIIESYRDLISQSLRLFLSGASDEEVEEVFNDIFEEKIDSVTCETAEVTVTFQCVKEDGEWLIEEVPEDVNSVFLCNMDKAYKKIKEALSDSDDEAADEDVIWHDVPIGETIELATINITVDGCEETDHLADDYSEVDASDGTKFIVFTVTIENTTKKSLDFDAEDITLVDDKDREYEVYEDASLYVDEAFDYTELAPNIPVKGYFIYNVPNDSEDYYFYTFKSGTDDGYKFYGE
ncbi:protein of unknown function [Lachnospiraceae bacterium XPB1003]|nr:protein of unknown function [Lachnospiraceae bacterium XPB1003]